MNPLTALRRRGIGTRLLAAQGLVVIASIGTAALVAALMGPPLFHRHLVEAGHLEDSPELVHIDMAYQQATLISLTVAVVVAAVCSLAVSWYLSRRIQEPLTALAAAAADMAGGHYDVRIPDGGAGPELDDVARSFNTMAERLEQTEDSRRRLLSDLGHELRTPISTIRAYLESVDDDVQDWNAETQEVVRDQVDRLARLASDVTDVSAAEEGQIPLRRRPIELAQLVEAPVEAAREAYASAGVTLVTSTPEEPCQLTVDPARIGQVLTNLLTNALRHSPAGAVVEVSARREGPDVVVAVADGGDGIAAAQLPHVFERFYRGDTARDRGSRGSGIGLTISKAIVEAHGGSIRAESPGPGRGTVVSFRLAATARQP